MKSAPRTATPVPGFGSPAWRSVAWQLAGAAATLAAAAWVSWCLGLAAQGRFGLVRSWFDAAGAIAALGLPQGLLHLQYRLKVPAGVLRPALARGLSMLTVLALTVAALLFTAGLHVAAMVAASLPFGVGHLLARSILLAQRGVVLFGVVTALPALLLLLGVLVLSQLSPSSEAIDFAGLLLLAGALAGAVSAVLAWRAAGVSPPALWPQRELWRVSLESWLQAALGGLLGASLLSVVAWVGQDEVEVGKASLGLHLYQLFAVASGYLAPLLFDRLARQPNPALHNIAWPRQTRLAIAGGLVISVVGVALALIDERLTEWLLPVALMIPAGMTALAARIAGTVLLARGAYTELSLQSLLRLLLAVGTTVLTLSWVPAAAAVAIALLVTELATWWRATLIARAEV